MTPTHALAASGFDRARGALFVRCACGWEDAWFPPDPHRFEDAMAKEEAHQLERLRRHIQEAARG